MATCSFAPISPLVSTLHQLYVQHLDFTCVDNGDPLQVSLCHEAISICTSRRSIDIGNLLERYHDEDSDSLDELSEMQLVALAVGRVSHSSFRELASVLGDLPSLEDLSLHDFGERDALFALLRIWTMNSQLVSRLLSSCMFKI